MFDPSSPKPTSVAQTSFPNAEARLRDAAVAMEASFLSEMLKSAGLGLSGGSFSGGAGEEHFSSFLRDAQAKEMAKAGGIGLAQTLFEAMVGRSDAPTR